MWVRTGWRGRRTWGDELRAFMEPEHCGPIQLHLWSAYVKNELCPLSCAECAYQFDFSNRTLLHIRFEREKNWGFSGVKEHSALGITLLLVVADLIT